VQDLTFLDYRDSGMAGTEDNAHPQSLYQAGKGDLTGKVVEAVRQIKPQVVLTFDANGGYGHPDHIAMHHAAVEAFHAAGDPTKFPDQLAAGLAPHQPNKLYYFVFPQSMVTAISEAMKAPSIEMPDDFQEMGVPDDQVTTLVDVSGYARQKEQAARCHRTQLSTAENSDPFAWLPEPVKTRYLSREFLVRAVPPITRTGEAPEDDLFAGLA
jgi:LmbE family N-acetylglucosaminyl deacetylase